MCMYAFVHRSQTMKPDFSDSQWWTRLWLFLCSKFLECFRSGVRANVRDRKRASQTACVCLLSCTHQPATFEWKLRINQSGSYSKRQRHGCEQFCGIHMLNVNRFSKSKMWTNQTMMHSTMRRLFFLFDKMKWMNKICHWIISIIFAWSQNSSNMILRVLRCKLFVVCGHTKTVESIERSQ